MNRPEIRHEPLVYEYRGDILDNVHMGCLALVDEAGKVVFSVGDPRSVVYMRSSAKPIQALPVIQRRPSTSSARSCPTTFRSSWSSAPSTRPVCLGF